MVLIGPQVSILILPSIFHNVATQLFSKGKNDYATSYFSFSRLPLALWRMTTNLNMANSPYTVWVSPFHCHHVSRSPTFFFIPSLFKLQDFFQFLECARVLWPWGFCTCSFLFQEHSSPYLSLPPIVCTKCSLQSSSPSIP